MSGEWTVVLRGDWYLPHLVTMLDAYRGNAEQRKCADEMIEQIDAQMVPLDGNAVLRTTTRPLVVIDPEDREQVERLLDALGLDHYYGTVGLLQAALREFADPTPPKPAEPTEWAAIAVESDGTVWHRVRDGEGDGFPWATRDSKAKWKNLDIVRTFPPLTVTSEGVTA